MLLYTASFFGYVASLGTRGGVQVDISAHGIFKQGPGETLKLKDLPFHEWFALKHHDVEETSKQTWDHAWYENEKKKFKDEEQTVEINDVNRLEVIKTLLVFNRIDLLEKLSKENVQAQKTILEVLQQKNKYKQIGAFNYDVADTDGLLVGGENISRDAEKQIKIFNDGKCEESTLSNTGSPPTTPLSKLVTDLNEGSVDIDQESKEKVKAVGFGQVLTGIIHYDYGNAAKDLKRKIYVYPANPGMNEQQRAYHAYPYRLHDTTDAKLFKINGNDYKKAVVHKKQIIDVNDTLQDVPEGKTSHELVATMALKKTKKLEGKNGFLGFTFIKGGVLKINEKEYFIPHRISGTSQTFNHTNIGCKNPVAKDNKLGNEIVKPMYMQFFKISQEV